MAKISPLGLPTAPVSSGSENSFRPAAWMAAAAAAVAAAARGVESFRGWPLLEVVGPGAEEEGRGEVSLVSGGAGLLWSTFAWWIGCRTIDIHGLEEEEEEEDFCIVVDDCLGCFC